MFFAAATLEQTAELGWISAPPGRDARAVAYEFAARWRHGMAGNSPLYMPGFFAVAIAMLVLVRRQELAANACGGLRSPWCGGRVRCPARALRRTADPVRLRRARRLQRFSRRVVRDVDSLRPGCLQFADLEHRRHCLAMVHQAQISKASADPSRTQSRSRVRASLDGGGFYFPVDEASPRRRTYRGNFFPACADNFRLPGLGRATANTPEDCERAEHSVIFRVSDGNWRPGPMSLQPESGRKPHFLQINQS